MGSAKFKCDGIILAPKPATEAANGELFRNSDSGDELTDKTTSGDSTPISSSSTAPKQKQNKSAFMIPANSGVSLRPDGGIEKMDSDSVNGQVYIGVALADIDPDALGPVQLVAPNAISVLTGFGFTPGQRIFMNQDGTQHGFTNDLNDLTGDNDSIIQAGVADCPSGNASAFATDLIMITSVEGLQ